MRVDPHPDLRVGNDLRVAVHVIDGEEAIMLRARVLRDDGARGTALRLSTSTRTPKKNCARW